MGYSRKEEIAKLRQQRREAKASKKRKEKVREKLVRFLIVCEGTKTEPHYFEALIKNYILTQGSGDRYLIHLYTNKKWHVQQERIQLAESITLY